MDKFEKKWFFIGDHVLLNNGNGIYTIELHKTYKIIKTGVNTKGEQLIAFDDGYDIFYNYRRFTKDIRPIRLIKLKKLYNINGD